MKNISKKTAGEFVSPALGESRVQLLIILREKIMCKTSKTISVIIRNHQYVDGKGYRMTIFGDSNICYNSCDGPMSQSDAIVYRSFSQTALQDCISADNREALEDLHMSLTEQQGMNSATGETYQSTDAHVGVNAVETEPRPKSNMRKWLIGLGIGSGVIGVIAYVFKKK